MCPRVPLQVVYEVLLPHFAGKTLNEVVTAQQLQQQQGSGAGAASASTPAASIDWQTPQRSGVGFYRCLPTALRFLVSKAGWTTSQYKLLSLSLRMHLLASALRDVHAAAAAGIALSDSDRRLVKLASKQVARAAVKLSTPDAASGAAPLLSTADAAKVLELTESVYGALRRATIAGAKFEYPPVLDMRMDARLEPLHGFDPLHDTRATDAFAGAPEEVPSKLFVDLAESGPKRTFDDVSAALLRAEIQTDRLRQKTAVSSPSIALQQICSLVEYLFTTVLPVPLPWSPELAQAGQPSAWIPVEISLTHQRAVIRAINRISVHYVAAAKSLKYDRMQVSADADVPVTSVACASAWASLAVLCPLRSVGPPSRPWHSLAST